MMNVLVVLLMITVTVQTEVLMSAAAAVVVVVVMVVVVVLKSFLSPSLTQPSDWSFVIFEVGNLKGTRTRFIFLLCQQLYLSSH